MDDLEKRLYNDGSSVSGDNSEIGVSSDSGTVKHGPMMSRRLFGKYVLGAVVLGVSGCVGRDDGGGGGNGARPYVTSAPPVKTSPPVSTVPPVQSVVPVDTPVPRSSYANTKIFSMYNGTVTNGRKIMITLDEDSGCFEAESNCEAPKKVIKVLDTLGYTSFRFERTREIYITKFMKGTTATTYVQGSAIAIADYVLMRTGGEYGIASLLAHEEGHNRDLDENGAQELNQKYRPEFLRIFGGE